MVYGKFVGRKEGETQCHIEANFCMNFQAKSAETVEYADCIFVEEYPTSKGCPDILLNNLIKRLQ